MACSSTVLRRSSALGCSATRRAYTAPAATQPRLRVVAKFSGKAEDLVKSIYDEMTRMPKHDMDGLMDKLAPGFEMKTNLTTPPFKGHYKGPEEFEEFLQCAGRTFEDLSLQPEHMTVVDGRLGLEGGGSDVLCVVAWHGKCKATHKSMSTKLRHVWKVDNDGRITRLDETVDAYAFGSIMTM